MAKMGRPSDFTQELADEILGQIADGKSLRSVCRQDGMPSVVTIFSWMRSHEDFLKQYERACNERTDAQQEDLLEMGDEAIELAQNSDPKAANAVVSAVKLKADNLKWSMSKMKPKRYGDKLDLTSGGEKLPTPIYGGKSAEDK